MVQVNNSSPINLRVKFIKVGRLQYISHLDLVRTMNKIIVRAKLPLWYTEGFNPKPKMVFAAPLSIGTESICEFVDIRLTEKMDENEALKALNDNLTDEMKAVDAYYPERKLTELKWLAYSIKIKTKNADVKLAKDCEDFLMSPSIEVLKKTKSGELSKTDIRPLIKSVTAILDGEFIKINAVISADSSKFLNPEYIIKALKTKSLILTSENLTEEYYSIMR